MIKQMALSVALVVLAAISGMATAKTALPYEHIGDYVSTPGESLHAFLVRMGPTLRAFSDKTGFESCAAIAQSEDGKTYSLVLGSNDSHMACAIYTANVLPGMIATGETIHSHGKQSVFRVNKADLALMSADDAARLETSRRNTFAGQSLSHFSPTDYASGPGYLATPTGLIYQDGDNREVAIQAAP